MIRIHTLGGLAVRGDGKPLAGSAAQPRRMAILALLARAGERGLTRDKLLALLWPDTDDDRGSRALTQALYALRKDLGAEDAIAGAKELRFDPALVSSDVGEFAAAVARGEDARAAALYDGPFLDGFHVPGADGFARWAEQERRALAHDYTRVLESLARAALAAGRAPESVDWWRKLAALEPLNARVTVGLMEALATAGDRAGAIRHAHVYELLVEQELDLPPDREVAILARRLQESTHVEEDAPVAIAVAPTPPPSPAVAAASPSSPTTPSTPTLPRSAPPAGRQRLLLGIAALATTVAISAALGRPWAWARSGARPAQPVLAIGHIASYGTDSTTRAMAGPVSDLLATSLARSPGLRVVSQGRMLELTRIVGTSRDTSAGGLVDAARRAGATEVIDGTLYVIAGGRLRLDLRRVDLATGAIGDVHTIEGSDPFTLVDSGTARLVTSLGTAAPPGSVAEVTTRSPAAYRLFAQGIRAYYANDQRAALGLFDGARNEDSLFALAAYYGALAAAAIMPDSFHARMDAARRLAARASDRDRLTIMADYAYRIYSPSLRALADTLVQRYPTEIEGHLYTGVARVYDGDFLGARAPLERVIAMDSGRSEDLRETCGACQAFTWLVTAYTHADSLPGAERTARRWRRLQPRSPLPASALASILMYEGRAAAAESSLHAVVSPARPYDDSLQFHVARLTRAGDYTTADRLLLAEASRGDTQHRIDLLWLLALSRREQGRLDEALQTARELRRFPDRGRRPGMLQSTALMEAVIQLDARHAMAAAALYDSLRALRNSASEPSQAARHEAWMLTHEATAYAAAGDTGRLAQLADTVRALGAESGFARDRRLYRHIRGLLLAARGRRSDAIDELRESIYSLHEGYVRTPFELARLLLEDARAREAVAVLQPPLRGPAEGPNLYVSRTDLHELLARAWEAAGSADSAAAHYAIVAHAWEAGDAPFRDRAAKARARAAALVPQRGRTGS